MPRVVAQIFGLECGDATNYLSDLPPICNLHFLGDGHCARVSPWKLKNVTTLINFVIPDICDSAVVLVVFIGHLFVACEPCNNLVFIRFLYIIVHIRYCIETQ
jgi:hypothetical protein